MKNHTFEEMVAAGWTVTREPYAIPLVPRKVATLADAEALRQIRNSCSEFMTGNPRQISAEEQREFWYGGNWFLMNWQIWLFDSPDGQPVGFGLFRPIDGEWWATLGLLPAWRGQGHGTAIYRHLIAQCPGDLHIDVLLTNVASARAAERAGFRLEDWNGSVATLVARKR